MALPPTPAARMLTAAFGFLVLLVGLATGAIATVGAVLQLASSHCGVLSMAALSASAAVGFAHVAWAGRLLSSQPQVSAERTGLILGVATVGTSAALVGAAFLRSNGFMNPYLAMGFFPLCVLPQFMLGLVVLAFAGVLFLRRKRSTLRCPTPVSD